MLRHVCAQARAPGALRAPTAETRAARQRSSPWPSRGPCLVTRETESGAHGASGGGDGVRVPVPKPTAAACLDQAHLEDNILEQNPTNPRRRCPWSVAAGKKSLRPTDGRKEHRLSSLPVSVL